MIDQSRPCCNLSYQDPVPLVFHKYGLDIVKRLDLVKLDEVEEKSQC
jgi:hypothetical protein